MSKKRVIIVTQGTLGPSSYEHWLNSLKRIIEFQDKATAEMLEDVNQAREEIKKGEVDSVVFISGSMVDQAEKLQKDFPALNISVWGGRFSTGKVILVDKGWALGIEEAQRLILNGLCVG